MTSCLGGSFWGMGWELGLSQMPSLCISQLRMYNQQCHCKISFLLYTANGTWIMSFRMASDTSTDHEHSPQTPVRPQTQTRPSEAAQISPWPLVAGQVTLTNVAPGSSMAHGWFHFFSQCASFLSTSQTRLFCPTQCDFHMSTSEPLSLLILTSGMLASRSHVFLFPLGKSLLKFQLTNESILRILFKGTRSPSFWTSAICGHEFFLTAGTVCCNSHVERQFGLIY